MAINNNAIYNAVLSGVLAGQERWIRSNVSSSYNALVISSEGVAAAVDSQIAPTTISSCQAGLMEAIITGIFANRSPTSTSDFTSIAGAAVALYNRVAPDLAPCPGGSEASFYQIVASLGDQFPQENILDFQSPFQLTDVPGFKTKVDLIDGGVSLIKLAQSTAVDGRVLTWSTSSNAWVPAAPAGAVSSVFSRNGAVVAANGDYNAQQISQLDIQAVQAVCTGNVALTGALTSDGYVFLNNDRALVAFQTLAAENGIYVVNTGGAWTRAADQNVTAEFRPGVWFKINNGTLYGGNVAALLTSQQPTAIIVGTTALQYGISSPPPVPITNDGNTLVPSGGILTYVNSPSHKESRLAQTASLAAITLLTGPPTDLYGLDSYIEYTAGTGTVLITFSYTDAIGATTQATTALAAVGRQAAHFSVNVASGNVTFTTTVVGTVTYNVYARAGRLLSTN